MFGWDFKFITGAVVGIEFVKEDDEEYDWTLIISLFILHLVFVKLK